MPTKFFLSFALTLAISLALFAPVQTVRIPGPGGPPLSTGITLVQTTTCLRNTAGTLTCTFSSAVGSGHFVLWTVTDSGSAATGITFNSVTMNADASPNHITFYSLSNITGGTVANLTCAQVCTAVLAEFSGVATSSPFDQATSGGSTGFATGTTFNSGLTGTLAQIGELAIGVGFCGTSSSNVLSTIASPFVTGNVQTVANVGDGDTLFWGYAVVSGTSAVSFNGTATLNTTSPGLAAYKHP